MDENGKGIQDLNGNVSLIFKLKYLLFSGDPHLFEGVLFPFSSFGKPDNSLQVTQC